MRPGGAGGTEPARRVDQLDAGREPVPLAERWRRLPRPVRLLLLAAVVVAAVAAALLLEERRQAERARAAVDLEVRLLDAPVPGQRPGRLEFLLQVRNRGGEPVTAESWYVAVEGRGVLDARLDGGVLPPGAVVPVPVPWGFPHCRTLPAPAPVGLPGTVLLGRVRTADGVLRDVRLPVRGVPPGDLLRAVQCPERAGGPLTPAAGGALSDR